MNLIKEYKKFSITDYLSGRGLTPVRKGSRTMFSSPFSSDSDPSFCVYEHKNRFFDYSTGRSGDIINLVMELEGCSTKGAIEHLAGSSRLMIAPKIKEKKQKKKFNPAKYLINNKYLSKKIQKYAESRRITEKYEKGAFYQKTSNGFVPIPSIMFVHVDEDLEVCGAKFRIIDPDNKQRFSSRGRLCFYVLENIIDVDSVLYIMESETSANSLYSCLKAAGKSFCILCVGGAANFPKRIPDKYSYIKDVRIILDWDGGAIDDHTGRPKHDVLMDTYGNFGKPILVKLDKGEDINSLYINGEDKFIVESYYDLRGKD